MTVESLETGGKVPRRKRIRTKPDHARVRLDKRFAIGKRVAELVATFRQRLGADADDPVMQTAITRCAETIAMSEQIRARALRGVPGASVDDALRLSRTAEAMTRRLIDRHKAAPVTPTFMQYLGTDRRGELELRIRALRTQLWSSPEDRRELEGKIEAAEAELRQLDGRGSR